MKSCCKKTGFMPSFGIREKTLKLYYYLGVKFEFYTCYYVRAFLVEPTARQKVLLWLNFDFRVFSYSFLCSAI